MSKKARELSAEEKRLWRRVAAGVKSRKPQFEPLPIEATESAPLRVVRAKLTPAAKRKTERAPLTPPANRGGEKRVRRGKVAIEGSLDLHGHGQDSALAALSAFLQRAQSRGARAVIVITGSGRGGEGMLRKRLPEWLVLPGIKPLVAGFAQAHRSHGGNGAFYVFLKLK